MRDRQESDSNDEGQVLTSIPCQFERKKRQRKERKGEKALVAKIRERKKNYERGDQKKLWGA